MSKELLHEFMHSGGLISLEDETNDAKMIIGIHVLQDVKNKKISSDEAKKNFVGFNEEPEAA